MWHIEVLYTHLFPLPFKKDFSYLREKEIARDSTSRRRAEGEEKQQGA